MSTAARSGPRSGRLAGAAVADFDPARLANALAISLCAASSFFAVDAAMVLMVRPRRFR
jgi:hypothetical protein